MDYATDHNIRAASFSVYIRMVLFHLSQKLKVSQHMKKGKAKRFESWIHTLARKAAFSSRDEQFGSTPSMEYGEEVESGSSLFLLSLQLGMMNR